MDEDDQVKIAICLLTKDCAQQLKKCLDSLTSQVFKDFVVVVADGSSKDNSILILQQFAEKDNRVHYFVQRSKGTGTARNELVNYVRDHFPKVQKIIWGDAENVYDKNYVQNIINEDAVVVGGTNIIVSAKPLSQSLWWYYNGWRGGAVSGNNECVDINMYENHCYTNVIRGEDLFFHQQLLEEKHRFSNSPQAICFIKTVESLSEFIIWTKRKAQGLFQWSLHKRMFPSVLSHYSLFNIALWSYFALFFVLVFVSTYLVVLYLFPPIILSMFLWQKGKRYVIEMKKVTFFYFIPILLLHFSVMLLELVSLRLSKN
jgi:glycosyltransferase involved in cell wall biosynthesis